MRLSPCCITASARGSCVAAVSIALLITGKAPVRLPTESELSPNENDDPRSRLGRGETVGLLGAPVTERNVLPRFSCHSAKRFCGELTVDGLIVRFAEEALLARFFGTGMLRAFDRAVRDRADPFGNIAEFCVLNSATISITLHENCSVRHGSRRRKWTGKGADVRARMSGDELR